MDTQAIIDKVMGNFVKESKIAPHDRTTLYTYPLLYVITRVTDTEKEIGKYLSVFEEKMIIYLTPMVVIDYIVEAANTKECKGKVTENNIDEFINLLFEDVDSDDEHPLLYRLESLISAVEKVLNGDRISFTAEIYNQNTGDLYNNTKYNGLSLKDLSIFSQPNLDLNKVTNAFWDRAFTNTDFATSVLNEAKLIQVSYMQVHNHKDKDYALNDCALLLEATRGRAINRTLFDNSYTDVNALIRDIVTERFATYNVTLTIDQQDYIYNTMVDIYQKSKNSIPSEVSNAEMELICDYSSGIFDTLDFSDILKEQQLSSRDFSIIMRMITAEINQIFNFLYHIEKDTGNKSPEFSLQIINLADKYFRGYQKGNKYYPGAVVVQTDAKAPRIQESIIKLLNGSGILGGGGFNSISFGGNTFRLSDEDNPF